MRRPALLLGAVLALLASSPSSSQTGEQVALVMGNGAYQVSPLRNPPNDARAMAAALRECGFEVIERIDSDQRTMDEAIREFGRRLSHGGVGVCYYAGHGMQVDGRNYLIPVGADIQAEDEVRYRAVDAGMVLGKMESAASRVNIVILDACRDNPFARSFRTGTRGLKRMDAPIGSFIAYATRPGGVAADGVGQYGLYTSKVLEHMRTPGLPVELVFRRVRESVTAATGDAQVPWDSSSLRGDFFFVADEDWQAKARAEEARVESLKQAIAVEESLLVQNAAARREGEAYATTVAENTEEAMRGFLRQFPQSQYAEAVRDRIEQIHLEAARTALRRAEAEGTVAALEEFLSDYPLSPHAGRARTLIAEIQERDRQGAEAQRRRAEELQQQLEALRRQQQETERPAPVLPAGQPLTARLPGGATMEFVWIEPGAFMMGSPASEPGRGDDEGPQHQVTISWGYYLGKYEITQGQWESVMGTTPWSGQKNVLSKPNHPAAYISWDDVQRFIQRLNEAAGESVYRLPTEAEWEYACRAGTTTRRSFGNDEGQMGAYAWYGDNAWGVGLKCAQPVGTKRPNQHGLLDVYGNVLEWCQDWYGSYSDASQVDPTGPASGSSRVVRGGDFNDSAQYVRSALRNYFSPSDRNYGVGARLLRTR